MTTRDATKTEEPGVSKEEIDAIAADWVIRLEDGPLTSAERDLLDAWLDASVEHRTSFEFASATWRDLGALRNDTSLAADTANRADAGPAGARMAGVDTQPRRAVQRQVPARKRMADLSVLRRVMRVSCLAVGFILAIGLAAIWEGDPGTLLTADYRTAPDETRLIDLADGSQVMLGPSSALALRFDGRRRGFDLLSGIAYVTASQTAADPAFRPFRVNAGRGAATALGTQYMVEVLDDTVRVTVAEHDVEVSLPLETGVSEKVILHPGDSVRYSARSGIQSVERVSLARATGWRDGRLVFDRVPLAEVVAVLNRYRRGKIVIANPDLAVRTVSGSFNTSELDHALHAIARELRATTTALPPFVTLLF